MLGSSSWFAYGGVLALLSPIVTDFFGTRDAGTLVGLIYGLAELPSAIGPVLGGWIFDATGR